MNNKKIAVCISGHPRTIGKTARGFFDLFGEDIDFFFSTWDSCKGEQAENKLKEEGINLKAFEYVSEPDYSYHELNILESYPGGFPDFFILSQWYGFKRSLRLMLDYEEVHNITYDYIFRARFDLAFDTSLEELFKLSSDDAINYIAAITKGSDQFFYGLRKNMIKFIDFEKWLISFPEKFGTQYGYFASPLVKAFVLDNNIKLNNVLQPIKVIRATSGSARELREARTRQYIINNFPDLSNDVWVGDRSKMKVSKPAPWDKNYTDKFKSMFMTNGVES
ncbi:hypothetical protein FBG13_12220 [Cobetia marina]|uniref:hypothetical protein n=1 Tax=Cobetia marina TaxID=28258 RepID=UPI0010AE2F29|nr:hypothetical protein [Cobetia marina]TKD61468.1 hypothetical protein FBG13_12220 [Cobetia marina]